MLDVTMYLPDIVQHGLSLCCSLRFIHGPPASVNKHTTAQLLDVIPRRNELHRLMQMCQDFELV